MPGTVSAPVCVIAPPAVADRLPPAANVNAGKLIAAALNSNVKLRKLLSDVKFVGKAALLLILRNPTSRMLVSVPPKVTAPVMLFACVCREMSLFIAVDAIVNAPAEVACVIAPDCVIAPPDVNDSVPLPTLDVPMIRAILFVKATLFAPLLESDTAPVNALLAWLNVIALAPAEKLDVPDAVIAPDCVMAPVFASVKLPTD